MRKPAIAIAALAVTAAASAAFAQSTSPTVLHVTASVSPNKAGTTKHPQGVQLTVKTTWATPADLEKPVTQRAIALFPKGSL
jgi:hypothetical protein